MVANLTAGIGVERSLIEHDFGFARIKDLAHGLGVLVSQKLGFAVTVFHGLQRRINMRLLRTLPGSASAGALIFHSRLEAFGVNGDVQVPCHVLLLVERETVSVVELEGRRTGDHAALRGLGFVMKDALGDQEGVGVAQLFFAHDARNAVDAFE